MACAGTDKRAHPERSSLQGETANRTWTDGAVGALNTAGTLLRVCVPAITRSEGEIKESCQGQRPTLRVVCISDTHNRHGDITDLPPGDVLIHAGDFTDKGTREEVEAFNEWLGTLTQYAHRLCVLGNHDCPRARPAVDAATGAFLKDSRGRITMIQPGMRRRKKREGANQGGLEPIRCDTLRRGRLSNAQVLNGQTCTIRGVRFFGTGYDDIKRAQRDIPSGTHVVVTHIPAPLSYRPGEDAAEADAALEGHEKRHGSDVRGKHNLLKELMQVEPWVHIGGHEHTDGGSAVRFGSTIFVNAAMVCGEDKDIIGHPAIVLEIPICPVPAANASADS